MNYEPLLTEYTARGVPVLASVTPVITSQMPPDKRLSLPHLLLFAFIVTDAYLEIRHHPVKWS